MASFLQSHKHIWVGFILLFVVVGGIFLTPHSVEAQTGIQGDTFQKMATLDGEVQGVTEKGSTAIETIVGLILFPFVWVFRLVGVLFMSIGGTLMTAAIEYSINFPINKIVGIQLGWQVMRDFANLFFIFIILWIAIKTILQLGNHDTKKLLVNVIVVALLINFSGFITRVVIDFGNVLAVGFYNTMLTSPAPITGNADCNGKPCTLDKRFASVLGINTLGASSKDSDNKLITSLVYLMTGIVLFVLGAVFFKAAFYFIARTIAFCFLVVFSPLAFIAYVFPSGSVQKFANSWWSKLWGYTLLAPAFMMIMYLALLIITKGGLDVLPGASYGPTIVNFLIVIGLIWVGTSMAFKLADEAGTGMANWGSKLTSGVALGAMTGAGGFAGRQLGGRWAASRANNLELMKATGAGGFRGAFARMRLAGYEKAAKGSWDVAQSKYGAAGAAQIGAGIPKTLAGINFQRGQGGFEKTGRIEHTLAGRGELTKTQEAEYVKRAKELYPDDPVAQSTYLRNNMGSRLDDQGNKADNYDNLKSKDAKSARGELQRKIKEKDTEKELEQNIKEYDQQNEMLVEQQSRLGAAVTAGDRLLVASLTTDIANSRATVSSLATKIKNASRQVRPAAIAGFGEKLLSSKGFAEHVDRNVLAEIHKQFSDGKYSDPDILQKIGVNVSTSSNSSAKEYLASPEGRRNLLNYSVPMSMTLQTRIFQSAMREEAHILRQLGDGSNPPNPNTLRGRLATETDPEKRFKLEEDIEKKEIALEKIRENIATMQS